MKVYFDITGFIDAPFMTGIQRVVREVAYRLELDDKIELVLLYCPNKQANYFLLIDNKRFIEVVDSRNKKQCVSSKKLYFYNFTPNSIFYDVDGVWINSISRGVLLPILKEQGIKIVTHIHDIIAINNPQYGFQRTLFNYMYFVAAQFKYANVIMTCSYSNILEYQKLTQNLGIEFNNYKVVPCGSDFHVPNNSDTKIDKRAINIAQKGKYILMVSTIEPRKNQKLLIDAYDMGLQKLGIQLVLVGREGWNVKELINRIKKHKDYNNGLNYLSGVNDTTLHYLYDNAFLVAFTSYNEGFGLPVVEGIKHRKIVIAADNRVLREVGKEYCDYYEQDNVNDFLRIVEKYVNNNEFYLEKLSKIDEYSPFTWDDAVEVIKDTFSSCVSLNLEFKDNLENMIIIASDKAILETTLYSIDKYMKFIKNIWIFSNEEIEVTCNVNFNIHYKVTEKNILNIFEDNVVRTDIDCLLKEIKGIHELKDNFLLSHERYRPLSNIEKDVFIDNDNRYIAYKFCNCIINDLDVHQKIYRKISNDEYDVNMPQIYNYNLLQESIVYYSEKHIEEGSSHYYNYIKKFYDSMLLVKPYKTLNYPNEDLNSIPSEYLFEYIQQNNYVECDKPVYNNFLKVQMEENKLFNTKNFQVWLRKYVIDYGVIPNFTLTVIRNKLQFQAPKEYLFIRNKINTIYINLLNPNSNNILLEWFITNKNGEAIDLSGKLTIEQNSTLSKLCIPINTIELVGDLLITYRFENSEFLSITKIPVIFRD